MAVIGYARTSTTEQNIEPQIEALKAAGCTVIFQEQRSGVDSKRLELARMLEYIRENDGDVVVCTKLDRIGRSTADVLRIVDAIEAKTATFRCLNINLDTSTPTGKLMLTMLAAVATFEREIMLERQRDGIAAAKAAGKYKGRKPIAKAKGLDVVAMVERGMTKEAVAKELNIGVATVYRIMKLQAAANEIARERNEEPLKIQAAIGGTGPTFEGDRYSLDNRGKAAEAAARAAKD